jgi:hypothetical protein
MRMCNTKRRYVEAGGMQTKFQMRYSVWLGVYRNEAFTEVFREPQGSDMRVPLHTGRIQDGGGNGNKSEDGSVHRTEVDMWSERMQVSGYPRSGSKHTAGQNFSC